MSCFGPGVLRKLFLGGGWGRGEEGVGGCRADGLFAQGDFRAMESRVGVKQIFWG